MNKAPKIWITTALLATGFAVSGLASAQSTWNLYNNSTDGCTQNASNAGTFGNSWSCKGFGNAGTTATASAWSTQNGSSTSYAQATSGSQYANAYLSDQGSSGFGAANRTEGPNPSSPQHAVDNIPSGQYDFVLLNFGTSVILNSIGIGWANNGASDLTVLRWTGSGSPTGTASASVGGNAALTTSGWSLVGSLAGLTADNVTPFGGTARTTGATEASSWWMISAFNTTLNGGGSSCKTASGSTTTCTSGDDAFKLNWVKTTVASGGNGNVPEPVSLALVGAALLGMTAVRRQGTRR